MKPDRSTPGMNVLLSILCVYCLTTVPSIAVDPTLVPTHNLFYKITHVRWNFTIYQHHVTINRFLRLPCYLPGSNTYLVPSEPAAYEWLLNGRQVRPHQPFVHAEWDMEGTLTVLGLVAHEYTLWCHVQVIEDGEKQDVYLAHQLKFVQQPVGQLIVGISVDLWMNEDAWEKKCMMEQYTCDCKRLFGNNVTQLYSEGMPNQFVRQAVHQTALNVCDVYPFCMSVSVDDFQCLNWESEYNATHFAELSFFLDIGRRHLKEEPDRSLTANEMQALLYEEVRKQIPQLQAILTVAAIDHYNAFISKCVINTYSKYYSFCVGYAGPLKLDRDECDLCPSGSLADIRLTNPRPPYTMKNYKPLLSDSPHTTDQHARNLYIPKWMDTEEQVACVTCPANTYAEEAGRSMCLPCPAWHMRPTNENASTVVQFGAPWLYLACPREGRGELRLVQVAKGMLGTRFADWVKRSNPISRVLTLVAISLVPLAVALVLMFVAYVMLDVGTVIAHMAKKILPLQIQIAEMTTAMASFKAEQRRVTDETYARMHTQ